MRVIRGQTQYRLFLSVFIEFYMIILALLDIDIEPKDVMAAEMETHASGNFLNRNHHPQLQLFGTPHRPIGYTFHYKSFYPTILSSQTLSKS